ncbi:MAG: hypothetical protein ACREIG_08035 [Nitrospiraceae bacterium]
MKRRASEKGAMSEKWKKEDCLEHVALASLVPYVSQGIRRRGLRVPSSDRLSA